MWKRADIDPALRLKLEHLGPDLVRKDFSLGMLIEEHEQNQTVMWLNEVEGRAAWRDSRRFYLNVGLAFIAAVASIIAAIPVVKEWIR